VTALFVLDTPENEGVVRVAEQDPLLVVAKVGPYFEIRLEGEHATDVETPHDVIGNVGAGHTSSAGQIVIDRRATGCRHAVWYSALAGLQNARVLQHDKNALRVVHRSSTEEVPGE
jgi:hypothetical protein